LTEFRQRCGKSDDNRQAPKNRAAIFRRDKPEKDQEIGLRPIRRRDLHNGDHLVAISQKGRLLSLEVPSLGTDILLPTGLVGHESLSSLFSIDLELISDKPGQVVLSKLLGQTATVSIELADRSQRYLNGVISLCMQTGRDVGGDARFTRYKAQLVPWLWLLNRTADCRIFQDMTAPEILQKVFSDLGFRDFRLALTQGYTKRDYCAQYRESDFNFVSRLMEQEGIFYFFEHQKGKHTLVLGDSSQAHQPCPKQNQARYVPEGGIGDKEDTVAAWHEQQELRAGKYTLRDHHFEMPGKTLEASTPTTVKVAGNDKLEIYDYPGEYAERFNKPEQRLGSVEPEGRKIVKVRMEEEETPHVVVNGSSDCRSFAAGTKFNLQSPPPGVTAGPFVLISVQHTATQKGDFLSGQNAVASYSNRFSCLPLAVPYRPRRLAKKPVMQGPQTAVVVGRNGEEIDCDKYGRVKVQFFWDRQGKKDENSSCFVRVATPWAGKQWGMIQIPRIGQEVIVSFLEGDPDQPIITGSVYNSENMPPYPLPSQNTRSGVKTRSTKGGGADNCNELRFEDKMGQEEVLLHAERNLTTEVEKDESRTVGNNRTTSITGDDKLNVQGSRTSQISLADKVSAMSVEMDAQTTLTCSADGTVTIQCGASQITMTPASITIQSATIQLSAPMVTADGVLMADGAVMGETVVATTSIESPMYSPGVGNLL
jgi:type VI secretion system secreted protein VgrG